MFFSEMGCEYVDSEWVAKVGTCKHGVETFVS